MLIDDQISRLQLHGPGLMKLVVAKICVDVPVAVSSSVWDEVLAQCQHRAEVQCVPVCPLEDGGRDPAEHVYGQQ